MNSKKILRLTCDGLIPTFCDELKIQQRWEFRTALLDLQKIPALDKINSEVIFMAVDKNLFLHDLSIVTILKDESS